MFFLYLLPIVTYSYTLLLHSTSLVVCQDSLVLRDWLGWILDFGELSIQLASRGKKSLQLG